MVLLLNNNSMPELSSTHSPLFLQSRCAKIGVAALSIAAVALVVIGVIGLAGPASLWLFIAGVVLFELSVLAVLVAIIDRCILKKDPATQRLEEILEEEEAESISSSDSEEGPGVDDVIPPQEFLPQQVGEVDDVIPNIQPEAPIFEAAVPGIPQADIEVEEEGLEDEILDEYFPDVGVDVPQEVGEPGAPQVDVGMGEGAAEGPEEAPPAPPADTEEPEVVLPQEQKALLFAKQSVELVKAEGLLLGWEELIAPKDSDISFLANLYREQFQKVEECLKIDQAFSPEYPKTPEALGAFHLMATELMQLGFALGHKTLMDVPKHQSDFEDKKTVLSFVSDPKFYFHHTIKSSEGAYTVLRHVHQSCGNLSEEEKQAIEERFYIEGTEENIWRQLYNALAHSLTLSLGDDIDSKNQGASEIKIKLLKEDKGPGFDDLLD
ncbi:hypothetical protein [Chlamydia vaughanii]|uniref:hypothetical protein n=1 Tax=Chlamydia vaughanii TaxID=3112552 RepID=UPI0032B28F6D